MFTFLFNFFLVNISNTGILVIFFGRFHRGDVLITTATGVMTEEEGEKWGLVPTHAYAVLEIREYKVKLTTPA